MRKIHSQVFLWRIPEYGRTFMVVILILGMTYYVEIGQWFLQLRPIIVLCQVFDWFLDNSFIFMPYLFFLKSIGQVCPNHLYQFVTSGFVLPKEVQYQKEFYQRRDWTLNLYMTIKAVEFRTRRLFTAANCRLRQSIHT
jgi:hypothetical protein